MKQKTNAKVYKYYMTLEYEYNNELIKIKPENISNFAISRDYINQHRPLLFVTLNLDKRLLQDMVNNVNKKRIICTLEKISMLPLEHDDENGEKIKKLPRFRVFKDSFIYIIPSAHINQNESIEYGGENIDRDDIFEPVMIGLVHPGTIKDNKVSHPFAHYKNTKITDLILKHMEHTNKLVLSPIEHNLPVGNTESFNSLTEFIQKTYDSYKFYDNGYRLFFDYDKTYLMSNNGKSVPIKGEKINTVIFNVHSPDEPISKSPGMITDEKHRHLLIDVDMSSIDSLDTTQLKDRVDDINEAAIYGLNNPPKKRKIDVLYITKELLDTELFTINKEYFVDHYNKLDNKRGRFILLSKKDLYTREGEFFKVNTTFILKFIKYE